jgi:hypothetical protein
MVALSKRFPLRTAVALAVLAAMMLWVGGTVLAGVTRSIPIFLITSAAAVAFGVVLLIVIRRICLVVEAGPPEVAAGAISAKVLFFSVIMRERTWCEMTGLEHRAVAAAEDGLCHMLMGRAKDQSEVEILGGLASGIFNLTEDEITSVVAAWLYLRTDTGNQAR